MKSFDQVLNKIIDRKTAASLSQKWKQQGLKVVFTNGCFDILHLGHVDYLAKASELGEKLIIGLNTDASISRIKGPTRPIQDQHARAVILAALQFVDAVVLFDESTPFELISELIPTVLVKGNDYTIDNIIGADIVIAAGGKVETIQLVEGYSTTEIVKKIQST